MGYIRKSAKKAVIDGEDRHFYMKGYATWRNLAFWNNQVIVSIDKGKVIYGESQSITQRGKDYFNDSLDRMSKVYNLTKVDQSLQ